MTRQEAAKKLRTMAAAVEELPADASIISVTADNNPAYDQIHLSAFGGVPKVYETREQPRSGGEVYREKRALVDSVPVIWDAEIVEAVQ